jgi:predicted RNase H-like HicB family nuclease
MKKITFQATLPVIFMREDKQFVAYTPALDLSTSGHTFELARRRFSEAVRIFIEECVSMGTLGSVLKGLGWKKHNQAFAVKNNLRLLNISTSDYLETIQKL